MRRAFSLVELLVVIAILAILAALLFPVFARAKAAAKQTTCISSLSQIGKAMALYMGDNDDIFPHALDPSDKYLPEIWNAFPDWKAQIPYMESIQVVLQPYCKSKQIFHCPSDSGTNTLDTHFPIEFKSSPSLYDTYGTSYLFRTEIAFSMATGTSLQAPADINLMFDGGGHWHGARPALQTTDSMQTYMDRLRNYRYNTLFADFHTKSITRDQLDAAWATNL